jgi:hypothetical protein
MASFIVFCLNEKHEKSVINQKLEVPNYRSNYTRRKKTFSLRLGINFFLKRKLSLVPNYIKLKQSLCQIETKFLFFYLHIKNKNQ